MLICNDCIWFSNLLYACFHPNKEGIRVFSKTEACSDFISKCEKEIDECKNCFMYENEVCLKSKIMYQGLNFSLGLEKSEDDNKDNSLL